MAADIALVTVSGQDRPGLMAQLTALLARHGAQVLDVGQAVIHEELALGLLVHLPQGKWADGLAKALPGLAAETGALVRANPISAADYEAWVGSSGQPRLVITLLMRGVTAPVLNAVSAITHRHGLNIDTVRRLSGRLPLGQAASPERLCVEMRVRGAAGDSAKLQADLMAAAAQWAFDFSVHDDNVFRRNRRLVAFDMDSTLINVEVMDELARRHGVGDRVEAITSRAMNGEIDFQESFRARAALLAGMPAQVLHEVAGKVPLNPGAERLIRALRHFGYRMAIISGGFQYVGDRLRERLGIDHVFANELRIADGLITGEVRGEIIDAAAKAALLRRLARDEGILLAQTIAIGDGANDLPMLSAAGLGVAYHAKQLVRRSASHAISNFGLDSVLYLMGFSDRDIDQALA